MAESRQRGDRRQPQGPRGPEGQIEFPESSWVWPARDDIEFTLYKLASELFASEEESFPSFTVRDWGLLESALALPLQPYYESFFEKLAAMVRSLAANHALVDGNKRLAVTVLHATLVINGYTYSWTDDEAVELTLRAATGRSDFRWLAEYVEAHSEYVGKTLSKFRAGELKRMLLERRGDS